MHAKKAITGAKRKKEAEKNRTRRLPVKTRLRRRVREAVAGVVAGEEGAREAVSLALREIDKGVSKGVVHRKTAARKKSRLMRLANASAARAQESD